MKKIFIFLLALGVAAGFVNCLSAAADDITVAGYSGDVKITPAGAAEAVGPKVKMALKAGDVVKTGAGSFLDMALDSTYKNISRVEENSHVIIKLDEQGNVELVNGKLFTVLNDLKKDAMFKVKTPCAVCGARGTGWEITADEKATILEVFDASVFTYGVNPDGSLMDDIYWTDEGFQRVIEKYMKPGALSELSEERLRELLEKVRKIFGRQKGGDKGDTGMDDKHRDGVGDRKDEDRLDNLPCHEKPNGPIDVTGKY